MPHVILRTTFDGREELLSEYICDWPDCPNQATVLTVVRALRSRTMICAEHAARIADRGHDGRR